MAHIIVDHTRDKMNARNIVVSLLVFFAFCCCIRCIRLGQEEELLLRRVLREFETAPKDGRFDRTIEIQHADAKLIPKILIWCPVRHNGLTINCPVHNCPLRVGRWTDVLHGDRADPRNPRLIYDLHGNLVLVQVFYECSDRLPGHEKDGHRYLSASNEILRLLPHSVAKMFPIIMQQRCAFTMRLYDYIITSIYQGQNFMEISEGIASMNFREFLRNNPDNDDSEKGFESNIFCSYPGNDKLMELFLLQFQQTKALYENSMCKHVGKVLSCDHTFKISKHVGVTRQDDGKFVRQFENVFLALNENGEVMTWTFTKSTSFSQIFDLLKDLKCRLDKTGASLEMVLVDDCCHVKNFYEQIFPGVKVRLDLFHACMRIVQTIPKSNSFSARFSNELSLIFRQDGDLGDEREMSTASPEEIEANLERLLFFWKKNLNKDTLHQIEQLRKHIRKGCLSDIPVGCGTEKNERLHRHLNRSLLCGVSKIGPELAIAVMTCVLYAWNCKRKGCHLQSKRVLPVVPIESVRTCDQDIMSPTQPHMKQTSNPALPVSNMEGSSVSTPCSSFESVKDVEELKTDTLLAFMIRRVLHLKDFLTSFAAQCKTKTVDMVALLWSEAVETSSFIEDETRLNTMGMDLTFQRAENLYRNLSGFNLELDKVSKDGNCFFRAVARQLPKYFEGNKKQTVEHFTSLGIGKCEKENTAKLRQLFVEEVTENISDYENWMTTSTNNLETVTKFKENGFFASEVGDLCARATAKLLRIPIIVVTALPTPPTIPFLPDVFATDTPIFVAYDHSGPGHYDATKEIPSTDEINQGVIRGATCTCGKNTKDPNKISCVASRCPCFEQKRPCSRRCRCHNCKNNYSINGGQQNKGKETIVVRGCRCGSGRQSKTEDPSEMSCRDGKRKSKCPCVAGGIGCTESCSCFNCGNIVRARVSSATPNPQRKRKRELVSPYKRKRGQDFMEFENASVELGPWRVLETLCLIVCRDVLVSNAIATNSTNMKVLYNYVAESESVKGMSLPMTGKSTAQVSAKMKHLKEHHTLQ